jgi:HEPN domain-containing protein
MRTPDQAKWDFVQQWLEKANKDLRAAALLLKDESEDYENVGFHSQQAAEKFIKAFLVRHQVEFPKTHHLAQLRALVASVDKEISIKLASADALSIYSVEYRYPSEFDLLTREQAADAVRLAEDVRDTVSGRLRDYLDKGRP